MFSSFVRSRTREASEPPQSDLAGKGMAPTLVAWPLASRVVRRHGLESPVLGVGEDELADEQCDEGVANSDTEADACRTSCREPVCGDSVTDAGGDARLEGRRAAVAWRVAWRL